MAEHIIHKGYKRSDAWYKATGRARYGADITYPGMLYMADLQSERAHAKILGIHTEEAERFPGVCAVYTAKDLPGMKMFGRLYPDEYFVADDRVRHCGDVVAMVVADSMDTARHAAALIKVDYEDLPIISDVHEALESDLLINEQLEKNTCCDYVNIKGDAEKGLEEADATVKTHYQCQYVEHAYIEPEAIVVSPGPQADRIVVEGSIQDVYAVRGYVCSALALPKSKVEVRPAAVGGSFGGKVEISSAMAARAGLACLKLNRPIKIVNTREESFFQSHKRHPGEFIYELGAKSDGTITGIKAQAFLESGGYVNETPVVAWKTITCGLGPYRYPSVDYHTLAIMTNHPVTGAMRGFGTPQCIFSIENTLNEMAEKLGMSPLEFRRKNLIHFGDTQQTGQVMDFHEVSVAEVVEKAAEAIDFERKYQEFKETNKGSDIRRGVGIACSMRGVSFGARANDVGRAVMHVNDDGSILVHCGLVEIGQGVETVLKQMAAEAMGVDFDRVLLQPISTSSCPETGAVGASRGTLIGGNAILAAAKEVQEIIASSLEEKFGESCHEIHFENDRVLFNDRDISFDEAAAICSSLKHTPSAVGTFSVDKLPWDEEKGLGDPYCSYTYSCNTVEVEVDLATGITRIVKIVGVHDSGRIINTITATGQVFGGIAQGVGMGIYESVDLDRKGAIKNPNFDKYIIPTTMDMPPAEAIFDDHPDPVGPFGARSLGEPATECVAAAIAGAISNALGGAGIIRTLPCDNETVFKIAQQLKAEGKLS